MDKKRIIKNKDLLYKNSVSLATAEVLTLVEDILFKKKKKFAWSNTKKSWSWKGNTHLHIAAFTTVRLAFCVIPYIQLASYRRKVPQKFDCNPRAVQNPNQV